MSDYRRNRVPGGAYFFTVNLRDRRDDTLVSQIQTLRDAVRTVKARHPFHIDAWVVLPDHTHCLWTLPEGDSDFSTRWKDIKGLFAKAQPKTEHRSAVGTQRDERGIWQRRFWEHTIQDDHDYAAHMDYIHFNPVKHSLVSNVHDWPYSSFHRCVSQGLYPLEWAGKGTAVAQAGERV